MKYKLTILMVIGCLVSFTGFAQDESSDTPLTVGGQVYFSQNFISEGLVTDTYDWRSGVAGGVFAEYRLLDILGVSAGALYHRTGTNGIPTEQLFFDREAIVATGLIKEIDLVYDRLEVPVSASLYLGNLRLTAGGSYNFLYNGEAQVLESLDGAEGYTFIDVSERLTRDEIAAFVAVGYSIDAGALRIIPEVQYNKGLTSINNITGKGDIYTSNIMVGVKVSYSLDLGIF